MTRNDDRPARVLIVEWNYDDMVHLEALIARTAPGVETHKTGNISTALKLLSAENFDAFFIRLDPGNAEGVWLASAIREIPGYLTAPIFFLAQEPVDVLALFRTCHCYDILEKPLAEADFLRSAGPLLRSLRAGQGIQAPERRFFVESRKERHILRVSDLLYAETDGNNLILHAREKTIDGIRMRLPELVRLAGDPAFLRCQRSFAVNLASVSEIRQENSKLWTLSFSPYPKECPCSPPYFAEIDRILETIADGPVRTRKARTDFTLETSKSASVSE